MIRKKVCMLGAYAVGKTSLVMRFVKNVFSERYRTTIGVRIHKKELELDGRPFGLLLWDLHGDDEFQEVRDSYLRGAAGFLLVADGTRAECIMLSAAAAGWRRRCCWGPAGSVSCPGRRAFLDGSRPRR